LHGLKLAGPELLFQFLHVPICVLFVRNLKRRKKGTFPTSRDKPANGQPSAVDPDAFIGPGRKLAQIRQPPHENGELLIHHRVVLYDPKNPQF
jgi:hypothetical protein